MKKQKSPGAARAARGGASLSPKAAKESLVERAYREIRRRILDNEYPPSHQVLEHELASDLNMSRTPVREALVRLQNENFVQLVPRHGMRVVPMSLQDLSDAYEVLTALELTAIDRLVASRPDSARLAPLAEAVNDMDRALQRQDADAWVKADERFHRTLIALAGNARLAAMAFSVWEQGHRARITTVRLRASLEVSNREHRMLLEAIRRGHASDAKRSHAKHRARTSADILKILEHTRLARV